MWKSTGTIGSDRRAIVGRNAEGQRITLHLQKTFPRTNGKEQTGGWSVSARYRPDLVLVSETHSGTSQVIVFDAKYRSGEQNILAGMAESVHPYHDALRWDSRRPDLALLLVPNADETEWLTREDYVDKHRVGVVALRPDIKSPECLRHLVTAHVTVWSQQLGEFLHAETGLPDNGA